MVVVTLTTDFGTRDAYAAELKAAILSLNSAVHLVDVTHEIAPHDVAGAALVLEAAAPWFPPGTVHLAVVDPGVGTARRGLVVAARGQFFVGPDNGLFTPVLEGGGWDAFELRAPGLRRAEVAPTFHGRDVFAPAAAHLSRGVAPEAFGPRVLDPVRLIWPEPRAGARGLEGAVIHVDRFGNLITSVRASALAALGRPAVVRVARRALPLVETYGDLRRGRAGALVGSSGRLELAVREGSAARLLGVGRGARVLVSPTRTRATTAGRARTKSARTAPG